MTTKLQEKVENLDRFKVRAFEKSTGIMYHIAFLDDRGKCTAKKNEQTKAWKVLQSDDIIVMQCTGLCDSVGELIYEGDWLWTQHEFDTFEVIREKSGRFIMVAKGKRACIVSDRVSIVGNVYIGGGAR